MAFEFNDYIRKLPEPLKKEEQRVLFLKLDEARRNNDLKTYEAIREKLINHNLRMCFDITTKTFKSTNYNYGFEDLMSESIICLTNAIDNFDLSKGFEFSTYAYRYVNLALLTLLNGNLKDSLANVTDVDVLKDAQNDGKELDIWGMIADDSESNIAGDFAGEEFVKDIKRFIDSFPERERKVFKMYTGIGLGRKYTQKEIGATVNLSQVQISRIISRLNRDVKKYIAKNYSITVFQSDKQFENTKERNQFVVNSYFGINGGKLLSTEEIVKKTNISNGLLVNIIFNYCKTLDNTTKESLKQKRKKELEVRNAKSRKKYYLAYFGLLGNEKKTLLQMAREENCAHQTISDHIQKVQNYLDTLTDEEKKQFLEESQDERD